jgi:cell division septal protein FtsQ
LLRRARLLRPVAGGRTRRRRGGLFNITRLAGAMLMLAASLALNWLTAAERFQLDPAKVDVIGVHFTDEQLARAALAQAGARPNLFRLSTLSIARAVEALPPVARAELRVALPDRLTIAVVERRPLFVWRAGDESVLVDAEGVAISPADAAGGELPLVTDERSAARPLAVGERLDSIDLAAALKLAALSPAGLDSAASRLSLSVEDEDGFVLVAEAPAWRAVFGHYTPNLRPVGMIDQQVQCLRSILAQREAQLTVVYLAPAEDRCGTFRARPTPSAHIFQNVGRRIG